MQRSKRPSKVTYACIHVHVYFELFEQISFSQRSVCTRRCKSVRPSGRPYDLNFGVTEHTYMKCNIHQVSDETDLGMYWYFIALNFVPCCYYLSPVIPTFMSNLVAY